MATPLGDSGLPAAGSERAWARALGLSRDTLRRARLEEGLRAYRPGGRRVVLLREDVLAWLSRHRCDPAETVEGRVERALAREEARTGA